MKAFLKLCNLCLFCMVGVLVGIQAIVIIALYVRIGPLARDIPAAAAKDLARGDLIQAAERLAGSAEAGWAPADRRLEAGILYLMAGATGPAAEEYRAALAAGASAADCQLGLARAAALAGQDPMGYYRAAMVATPGDPWPAAEAAVSLAAAGRRAEALSLLDEAERLRFVADPSLEAGRALILLAANDVAGAKAAVAAGAPIAVEGTRGAGEYHRAAALLARRSQDEAGARKHLAAAEDERFREEDALRSLVLPPQVFAIWSGGASPMPRAAAVSLLTLRLQPEPKAEARDTATGAGS